MLAAVAVIAQGAAYVHQIRGNILQGAFICQAKIYFIHPVYPFSYDGIGSIGLDVWDSTAHDAA